MSTVPCLDHATAEDGAVLLQRRDDLIPERVYESVAMVSEGQFVAIVIVLTGCSDQILSLLYCFDVLPLQRSGFVLALFVHSGTPSELRLRTA